MNSSKFPVVIKTCNCTALKMTLIKVKYNVVEARIINTGEEKSGRRGEENLGTSSN